LNASDEEEVDTARWRASATFGAVAERTRRIPDMSFIVVAEETEEGIWGGRGVLPRCQRGVVSFEGEARPYFVVVGTAQHHK
jgi:hypothetical protein